MTDLGQRPLYKKIADYADFHGLKEILWRTCQKRLTVKIRVIRNLTLFLTAPAAPPERVPGQG